VRYLFFALLATNLVYFAWVDWIDGPRSLPPAAAVKLPAIKMAGEVTPAGAAVPVTEAAHRMALNEAAETARCMSIGPFADIESSARAAAVLKEKGFDPAQRAAVGEASQGFWVYVGGLKNDAEVANVVRDLVYHGIADAHAMADSGAADRRVSVGLFSERDRAEKRAKAVAKLGLKAEVAEHKLAASVYWIDVSPQPGVASVPIDDLLAERLGTKVGIQACPPPTAVQPLPSSNPATASTASAATAPAPGAAPGPATAIATTRKPP
jgi:hypothetical protein